MQIDDAFLPYMYERMVPPMSKADYLRWAELRIAALNRALAGIPEEQSRYFTYLLGQLERTRMPSTCRSKNIIDLVLQIRVGHYSFEAANPRHALNGGYGKR